MSIVLVLLQLVLFYKMGVTTLYFCNGTVVQWLVRQDGSAVVGNRHLEWECRFRLFSRDVVNILLKTSGGNGRQRY